MPSPNDQLAGSNEREPGSEWLSMARTLLASLSTTQQAIATALGRREISTADTPAIDLLSERVDHGLVWIEQTSTTVHAEASTELRAALGVLRNLAFAVRRLSAGDDNDALRRSCDALIAQSHLHVAAAARAVDEASRRPS